jgi:hypothetical protein
MNTNTSHYEHAQQVINSLKEHVNKLAKENALPGLEIYFEEGYIHGLLGDLARDVPGVTEYLESVIKINNVS